MSYLLNCWYVAALADELGDAPLGRTLLDSKIVLFRDADGVARALTDRCPHRFVPLSAGRVCDGAIECAYHGLRFDGNGRCVHNPQGQIPSHAGLRSFPLIEKSNFVWIWMGEEQFADAKLIPDYACNDPDKNYFAGRYLHLNANYQNATDNILDLSHVDFVHRDTLGLLFQAPEHTETAVRREGSSIWSDRKIFRALPGPASPDLDPGQFYDSWSEVRWNAPACMLLYFGRVPSGSDPTGDTLRWQHTHIFTPETLTSTHYWFGVSHAKARGHQFKKMAEDEVAFLNGPFTVEDAPILALQQDAVGTSDFWDQHPWILEGDAAAVRARRTLDKAIREEQRMLDARRKAVAGVLTP